MVGFLTAGFAYNLAGFDIPEGLQTIADLGVTLLLFSIGLKLKIRDLARGCCEAYIKSFKDKNFV